MRESSRTREDYYREKYRPRFHYTSETGIINDPNGLVFYGGEYHLFHQYNVNNRIHWGHAVSADLLYWEHLEPSLAPDSIGQIWSGSVVVDRKNTSGLQVGAECVMVALFTYNEHVDGGQSQGLAFSRDRGRSWKKYCHNPVLTGEEKVDFRDPKVFWYEEQECWIMVLACGRHVEIYRSLHLTDWEYAGAFGEGEGSRAGIWECPDLYPMNLGEGNAQNLWVLSVSLNQGAPAGGTGMQYFLGEFDGKHFHNRNSPKTVLWLDYGQDFYAGVTWNDVPDGRRLMIGWADNWQYRDKLPTYPFRGQFSTVRELFLEERQGEVILAQRPAGELKKLRGTCRRIADAVGGGENILGISREGCWEVKGVFRCTKSGGKAGFFVRNASGECLNVGYDFEQQEAFIDRSGAGLCPDPQFSEHQRASVRSGGRVTLHLLVDRSQAELFVNDGRTVMTSLFFMEGTRREIGVFQTVCTVQNLELYELKGVWGEKRESRKIPFSKIEGGVWGETILGLEGNAAGEGFLLAGEQSEALSIGAAVTISTCGDGAAAGFVFGRTEGGDYKIVLDAGEKCILFLRGCETVERVPAMLNREREYRIRMEVRQGKMEFFLDGVRQINSGLSGYFGGEYGLYVKESLARFRNIQTFIFG